MKIKSTDSIIFFRDLQKIYLRCVVTISDLVLNISAQSLNVKKLRIYSKL